MADEKEPRINVVWRPTAGPQQIAITANCNRVLLTGGRGSGKSDVQLMCFRRHVNLGYGDHLNGIVVDRSYKSLLDLITKSKRLFYAFDDGCRFLNSSSQLKWIWPGGETLRFATLNDEESYNTIHGSELPIQLISEAGKYPDPEIIDKMATLCRSGFIPSIHSPVDPETGVRNLLPEIPLQQIISCNPSGVGHRWLKERFIDPAPFGKIVKTSTEVFNPRTKKQEIVTKTQVAIHSDYRSNPYLSPEYVADLESLVDENLRAAWLRGEWNITTGGLVSDVFDHHVNVIKDFHPPEGYKIWRGYDWGSSAPAINIWFCESDGSPIIFRDGTTMRTVRGDVFAFNEIYFADKKTGKGLRLLPGAMARQIITKEIKLDIHHRVQPGPCDSSIFSDVQTGASIAGDMAAKVVVNGREYPGPTYVAADKSRGSRLQGLMRMRTAFACAKKPDDGTPRERPALFFTESCQDGCIDTIPTLTRDPKNPDDCPVGSADHAYDCCRYSLLALGDRFKVGGKTIGYF